jgi:hypothetical protein
VRKELKREPKRGAVLLATCLAILAGGAAAAISEGDAAAGGQQALGRIVLEPSPAAQAVEPILARLWASGFFRRNEAVRGELLNNNYAFYDEGNLAAPKGSLGWGCYSRRPGAKDTIYLRQELFAHFELEIEGVVQHTSVVRKVLPVLVHEICHDLWMNVLDDRERAAFAREGDALMEEYRTAQTDEDKRRFLLRAGDDADDRRSLRSYSGIDAFLATSPPRDLCGRELFAWLAERLFVTKAMIPKPLRKYYSCVLAGVPSGETDPER